MRRHMRVRAEQYKKFVLEFDKCGKEAMVYDRNRGDSFLAENLFKIAEPVKRKLFDYLFNHSLIEYNKQHLGKLHADEVDNQYRDNQIWVVRGFPVMHQYLRDHEFASLFAQVDQDYKAGLFDPYTEMRNHGSKMSFAGRSSASFARQDNTRFDKKAQEQHRTALLKMIEHKDLKKVFQTFIGPKDAHNFSISLPRAYYVGVQLKYLEITFGRDPTATPILNSRRTRLTVNTLKDLPLADLQS